MIATLCIVCPLPRRHFLSLLVGDTIWFRSSHMLLSSSKICSRRFSELGVSSIIDPTVVAIGVVGETNSLVIGVMIFDWDKSFSIACVLLVCRVVKTPVSTSLSKRWPAICSRLILDFPHIEVNKSSYPIWIYEAADGHTPPNHCPPACWWTSSAQLETLPFRRRILLWRLTRWTRSRPLGFVTWVRDKFISKLRFSSKGGFNWYPGGVPQEREENRWRCIRIVTKRELNW